MARVVSCICSNQNRGDGMQTVFYLLGGLGFLFLGMDALSRGLSDLFRPAGERLDVPGGFLRGLCWTAAVQSSSAVTACLVSMSEAGILTTANCFPMLLGANVGTTITVWFFSGLRAAALRGTGLPLAFLAFLLRKRPAASTSLLGLSLVLAGMELLQLAAAPLHSLSLAMQTPWCAFSSSLALTAVIQSSAVSIGALQGMGLAMDLAVPAILGANIGTSSTGLLAASMLGRAGKRTALLELGINLAGALLTVPFLPLIPAAEATPARIAAAHTLVNALTAAVLLPFTLLFFTKKRHETFYQCAIQGKKLHGFTDSKR